MTIYLPKILSPSRLATIVVLIVAGPAAHAHHDVLFPDGGESFQPGTVVVVDWTVTITHTIDSWDVFYSTTGDIGPWIPIEVDVPAGDPSVGSQHTLSWLVPDAPTSEGRILVRMKTATQDYDFTSDGDFTIESALGVRSCAAQVANSSGAAATLFLTGSDVASDNAIVLNVTSLPANAFGYPVSSDTLGFVAMPGGSQGNLCLGGTIGRHVTQISDAGAGGFVSIPLDLTALPRPIGTIVATAGETWSFQYWTRDANPSTTSNFSDVVSVTLL